jgi:hypothetical protein
MAGVIFRFWPEVKTLNLCESAALWPRYPASARMQAISLPPRLAAEIARRCRRLSMVDSMLKEIDAERDAAADISVASSAPLPNNIQRLAQLRGIGPLSDVVAAVARSIVIIYSVVDMPSRNSIQRSTTTTA